MVLNTGMIFVAVAVIIFYILERNKKINGTKFFKDSMPLFKNLMEEDYEFLVKAKYNGKKDPNVLFNGRVRDGIVIGLFLILIFMQTIATSGVTGFAYVIVSIIVGFITFKLPYFSLSAYYKAHLHQIDSMLPYFLKSLEILIQHYTVPVALKRSVETAPGLFKPGLEELVNKIEAGDMSIDPYMDFANQYPVRDSMRMMRLLYRLGLGSQENKQEQLLMFSRTVSALQNKAREEKYKERLEKMEQQTMIMLTCTGSGIIVFLLYAMLNMMNI